MPPNTKCSAPHLNAFLTNNRRNKPVVIAEFFDLISP